MLWKVLKYSTEEKKLFLYFSFYLVKISHSNEVCFSDWIKAYIFLSKALFLNDKIDDAINLLINLLDIFPCIPIEDFKYLSEVYRMNNISLTNMFVNFDISLKYFSKYHVYEKTKGIFIILEKLKRKNINKEKVFFYKNHTKENTTETNISDAAISLDNFGQKIISKRYSSSNHTNFSYSTKNEYNKQKKDHSYDNFKNRNFEEKNSNFLNSNDSNINYNSIDNEDNIFDNSNEKILVDKDEKNQIKKNCKSKKSFNNFHKTDEYQICNTNNIPDYSIKDSKPENRLTSIIENSNNNNPASNSCNLTNLKDIGCDNYKKLEKYIDDNIEKIHIPNDSPCNINYFLRYELIT